jgi:CBS domain-containing protein/RimJ/RimL family protein N-acetyltransferase
MTPSPLTIHAEDSVLEAYETMKRYHIRRLPVLQGEKLVGVITITDIRGLAPLGALAILEQNDLVGNSKIARAMTLNPITVNPDENVGEAARLMMKHKVGGLPVMENGKLIGVISEADVFRMVIAENWHPQTVTPASSDGEEILWLRRGEAITLRPIRPDDVTCLLTYFGQMTSGTVYDRFIGHKKTLSEEEARSLASLDYDSSMGLVATKSEAHAEETIVGVAHYYVQDTEPSCAEFAIVIGDAYQRLGLGTHLMMRLMEYAKAHGVQTLLAFVHSQNYCLLRFVQRAGVPVQRKLKDGLWEIRIQIEEIDFFEAEKFASSHIGKYHEHQYS